jgi:hypothetical protein
MVRATCQSQFRSRKVVSVKGKDAYKSGLWYADGACAGPISSVTVMGKTMIIINDAKVAFDLLDKRSVNYSSRPRQVFAGEMYGACTKLCLQVE